MIFQTDRNTTVQIYYYTLVSPYRSQNQSNPKKKISSIYSIDDYVFISTKYIPSKSLKCPRNCAQSVNLISFYVCHSVNDIGHFFFFCERNFRFEGSH